MKYIAVWLGVAAVLGLLAIVIAGGAALVEAARQDPALLWLPGAIAAILLIATIAAVVEYLTDQRKPPETPEL